MPKFIISNRRAGRFGADAQKASRASMEAAFGKTLAMNANIVSAPEPAKETSRKIIHFEADAKEVGAKMAEMPDDAILEPEILHYNDWTLPVSFRWMRPRRKGGKRGGGGDRGWTLPLNITAETAQDFVGTGKTLSLQIVSGSKKLSGVSVTLYVRGPGGNFIPLPETSSKSGKVKFTFGSLWTPAAVFANPPGNYWPLIAHGPRNNQKLNLAKLPQDGPSAWWHESVGASSWKATAGRGIKVGVVDTGVGPNVDLDHVERAGAFIDGSFDPNGTQDSGNHGSHVAGIIGARPQKAGRYGGIAPGSKIHACRVFPPGKGANQGDIVKAIDALSSKHQCDLINLSLGSPQGSEIGRDGIRDALERGTLCICAAGNSGESPLLYPAEFDETVSVTALGMAGWGEPGSPSSRNYPEDAEKYADDGLYLASFSNFGAQADCCAPGVGLVAPVPSQSGYPSPNAAMDGTSMASALACGTLAVLLSGNAEYKNMPRNQIRAERARQLLRTHCRDIGLSHKYQGSGLVQVK